MAIKKYLSAFLILVILTTSIYIMMPDKVKIVVENTRTKYYVWEDESWTLGATEYLNLFDGTTKMRAKSREVITGTDGDITTIVRNSKWKDNITTIQSYTFDSTIEDVEMVPIENKLECFNCEGKIVHYEYRDILYKGETKYITSPFSFGHNMKLEWQDGYEWAKVYQQKVASDKIIIRYKPQSDYDIYDVRLFDPPAPTTTTLYLDGSSSDRYYELGTTANLTASTNITGVNVCISIDQCNYGTNYSCGTTPHTYNFTTFACNHKFNDSTTSKNLTYNGTTRNNTFYIELDGRDSIINAILNLTGHNTSGQYPRNLRLYINETLSNSFYDILYTGTQTLASLNDSTTSKNITFIGSHSEYLLLPKDITMESAKLDIKGYVNLVKNNSYLSAVCDYAPLFDEFSMSFLSESTTIGGFKLMVSGMVGSPGNLSVCIGNTTGGCEIGGPYIFTESQINISGVISFVDEYFDNPLTVINQSTYYLNYNMTTQNSSDYYEFKFVTATGGCSEVQYPDGSFTVNGGSDPNGYIDMNFLIYDGDFPLNPYLDVGADGTNDWSYSGVFNDTDDTPDFGGALNTYLESCSQDDDGFCEVPIRFNSETNGTIEVSEILIKYTELFNPFTLSTSIIQNFLTDSNTNGSVIMPIRIQSGSNGTVEVSDIEINYYGSDNITITANYYGNATYSASNDTQNLLVRYSPFTISILPTSIDYWDIGPNVYSYTQSNVVPYGNDNGDGNPFWSIVKTVWDHNVDMYIRFNTSIDSCITTWFEGYNQSSSSAFNVTLNSSAQMLIENISSNSINYNISSWSNLSCASSNSSMVTDYFCFNSMCEDCVKTSDYDSCDSLE